MERIGEGCRKNFFFMKFLFKTMSQNFYSVVLLYGGLPLPLQTVLYGVVHVTYSHVHLYIASCLHRQKVNQEDRVLK
jgi:hypothetical protein